MMAQCLECGIVEGGLGSYFTCRACQRAGRSPEARRAGRGSPPVPYAPSTEIRIHDISVVRAESVPVELRFSVKKNRQGPSPYLTYKHPTARTRFQREDPI
jgi:hypothetical protein